MCPTTPIPVADFPRWLARNASSSYGVLPTANMGATGSKPAVVGLPDDRVVELYAMESPEPWFEDSRVCRVAGWGSVFQTYAEGK